MRLYTNTYFECFHLVESRSANRVARKEDHPHREEQTWLKMLHPPQAHRSLATPWYSISPVLFAACTARKCSPTMALRSSWKSLLAAALHGASAPLPKAT